LLKNKKM